MKRLIVVLTLGMTFCTSASAAVTDVGTDNATLKNWRTAAANDLDGDNMYGTDGYILYSWNSPGFMVSGYNASNGAAGQLTQMPSYVSAIVTTSDRKWGGDGFNYGTLQNPASANADHIAPILLSTLNQDGSGGSSNSIVVTIHRASNQAFRLTAIIGGGDGGGRLNDDQFISINAGSAGSIGPVTHIGLSFVGVNYRQFDIGAGTDPIVFTINGGGTGDSSHLTGFAFDSIPIPEPAMGGLAFAAFLGLALIARRRNPKH